LEYKRGPDNIRWRDAKREDDRERGLGTQKRGRGLGGVLEQGSQ